MTRGDNNSKDTELGAIVRANIMRILAVQQKAPSDVYGAIGVTASRFWAQFAVNKHGPRLSLLVLIAEYLGVGVEYLLMMPGQDRPGSVDGHDVDHAAFRELVRLNRQTFIDLLGIDEVRRSKDTELNHFLRVTIRTICALNHITERDLQAELKIARATWHAMWHRTGGLALDVIWKMADVLDVEPWEIVADYKA